MAFLNARRRQGRGMKPASVRRNLHRLANALKFDKALSK
jgi:hypothetical protein